MSLAVTNLCAFGVDVEPKGNDTFTKALLHMDGADAATTFFDANLGGSAHTWTARGNAQVDTAQFKFSGASLLCDGTGDYLDTPDSADFTLGSANWTVDCWVRINSTGTRRLMAGQCDSGGGANSTSIFMEIQAANTIRVICGVGAVHHVVTGTTTLSTGQWYHIAFVRVSSTVLNLFVNGIKEGGDVAISGTINDSSNTWSIGRAGEVPQATVANWDGWIDEFRVSAGIARWTANFTPPTQEYR